jgi:hypothetical protein
LISLSSNNLNKPQHGIYIFDSAVATTKQLEKQSNQECMAKVIL